SDARRNADKVPAPAPVLQLDVEAPGPLATLLRRHLALWQVNRLAGGEPLPEGELERLVAAAPDQVRALLATDGYFNAQVQADLLAGDPPHVRVSVDAGPRTLVRDVRIDIEGPLLGDAERGERQALRAQKTLRGEWPLKPGAPFRDEDWGQAKTGSLARLRAQGYVDAQWASTQAVVDAATQRADLSATLRSGPLFRTGPLQIEGLRRQDEQTVRNIASFGPGLPATEELLLDFQERLQKSDLFDRASVTLAPNPSDPNATPVLVRLGERRLQDVTIGLGVSANVGAHATLEHTHRRPFGRAWIARNKVDVAQREQRWDGELSTQTLPGLHRNLIGGSADRVISATDTVVSGSLRLGRAQESNRVSRLAFVETQRSVRHSRLATERASSLALHYHGIWRNVDSLVLPTRGVVWTGQAGVGEASSKPGSSGPFMRLYGQVNAYRPFGKWLSQGRLELGQVFARDQVLVPEALRFRAGGEGSVRGYAYRSLTPVINGVETSGKVLFTASAEIGHPLLERYPQLLGATFIDLGRAAMRWSDLNPALGIGVGLRYRSPVGPVKLDVAWGEEVHSFRLHLTVGVEFQP
ncbi:MAG TPA: BamA/TamA family outer membrane protein, partial [Burkholderiaceae bacterium]|nr:BamA/TamA family outer membrane protein [Burkholderiaceae bacterium]